MDCETFYALWGQLDSRRTPLICLHGGPGSTSAYMKPFSHLATDYGIPVIIYDQLGCGQSTHLREKRGDTNFWNFDLFIAELVNLMTALNITTFDLLGHSWGGQLACRFAAEHQPKGLRKLVVTNSTAVISQRADSFKRQMVNLPAPFCDAAKQADESDNMDTPEYKAALEEYFKHHMCRLDPWPQELLDSMAAMGNDDTVHSTLDAFLQRFDLRPDLRKITTETVPGGMLIMNGKYDQATDEVMLPYFTLPTARVKWVRFAESSHMAILEETEDVLAATGQFLMVD